MHAEDSRYRSRCSYFFLALLLFVLAVILTTYACRRQRLLLRLLFVLAVILSAAKDPEAFYSPIPFVPFCLGFLSVLLLSR
jgi:hypothetical protein